MTITHTPMARVNAMENEWVYLPMSYNAGGGPAAEVNTGWSYGGAGTTPPIEPFPQTIGLIYPDEIFIYVVTAETTGAKTLTVGTLSTDSGGVAAGFLNAISTASTGLIAPSVTFTQASAGSSYMSASTLGSLFLASGAKGTSTKTWGWWPQPYIFTGASPQRISYTVVTASVAFVGWLIFRVRRISALGLPPAYSGF